MGLSIASTAALDAAPCDATVARMRQARVTHPSAVDTFMIISPTDLTDDIPS